MEDMGCVHMKENRPTTSAVITSAFAVPANGLTVPIMNGETVSSTGLSFPVA